MLFTSVPPSECPDNNLKLATRFVSTVILSHSVTQANKGESNSLDGLRVNHRPTIGRNMMAAEGQLHLVFQQHMIKQNRWNDT